LEWILERKEELKMRETDMDNPNIQYCMCDLCKEKIHPLDAHFGSLNGKLITKYS
jgi:hypothetical protein